MTSATNPWNAIYKMAAGKTKRTAHITTLRQQDGSMTTNLQDTLLQMIKKFAPDDNQEDDTETHRKIRVCTHTPPDTDDDEEFTIQEVTNVVMGMGNKKAPGEDGILNEVWKGVALILPKYLTAIYNGCLKEGVFPKRWKKSKIIPIVKPGKEGSDEVNKFRPISLFNSGGKVLEKLMIGRINHHVYSREYMRNNQYGFRPQKSTVDAPMAIKDFVKESLEAGEVIVLVSLDVQGPFDAAWWPGVLREMKKCMCPRKLYKLAMSYFTQRTAALTTNSLRIEKEVTRGFSQGACCGPGF